MLAWNVLVDLRALKEGCPWQKGRNQKAVTEIEKRTSRYLGSERELSKQNLLPLFCDFVPFFLLPYAPTSPQVI